MLSDVAQCKKHLKEEKRKSKWNFEKCSENLDLAEWCLLKKKYSESLEYLNLARRQLPDTYKEQKV